MDFITAIRAGIDRALDFDGRARRSEFWWLMVFGLICTMTALSLDTLLGTPSLGVLPDNGMPEDFKQSLIVTFRAGNEMLTSLVGLVLFIPLFSVLVRRLHDIGWSGYWAAAYYAVGFASGPSLRGLLDAAESKATTISSELMLVAFVNIIAFIVWLIAVTRDSDKGPNQFGPLT